MIGETLGHYQILEKLGQGGMGIVYRARDLALGRMLALKVLTPEALSQPDRRRRFLNEARAASSLNHPNIVTIYEVSQADGVDFIAMEWIDGEPLHEVLRAGPLPIAKVKQYGADIGRALDAAHAAGVVHRDIKPGNVLITRDGRAKVLDFGLAKLMEPEGPSGPDSETRTAAMTAGMILGTVAYMSPEQAEGRPIDHRSDLFSLGIVIFEMLTGKRPFRGNSSLSTLMSIIRDPAPDPGSFRQPLPSGWAGLVQKALMKRPEDRYQSAAELLSDLAAARIEPRSYLWHTVAISAALLAIAGGGWMFYRQSQIRSARELWIPEARRLADRGKINPAFDLIVKASAVIPEDPEVKRLLQDTSIVVQIDSEPSGAKVWRKDPDEPEGAWRFMGVTPIRNLRTATGIHLLRFAKEGYSVSQDVTKPNAIAMTYKLAPKIDIPQGMVLVPPTPLVFGTTISELPDFRLGAMPYFVVDRHEVTNREFKAFIEAGGYRKQAYWKEPFRDGTEILAFERAIARFVDSSGRPGPATWVGGTYEEGKADFPVSGVSWYEAAAYSEFAGKKLLTLHHWYRLADLRISMFAWPLSNIGGRQIARVGQYAHDAHFGAFDVIGNVKEWIQNEAGDGKRYILGGAASEIPYQSTASDARSSWDRSPSHGFRCARYPVAPLPDHTRAYFKTAARDVSGFKPVSDETFAAISRFYECGVKDLEAKVEGVEESAQGWRKERVSYRTCYGNERAFGYLFLPKSSKPPYQCLLYQSGSDADDTPSSAELFGFARVDFMIRSGRAVFWPVVKGTYERRFTDRPQSYTEYRERFIQRIQDLLRSVDYLATRPDVRTDRIAYAGTSSGVTNGVVALALDQRFRAALLFDGGLPSRGGRYQETDPLTFAPRVKVPVLMVNGRLDFIFPVETSQQPLLRWLGSPEKDKRHVILDTAHDLTLMRSGVIREVLPWLDRNLGPVEPR